MNNFKISSVLNLQAIGIGQVMDVTTMAKEINSNSQATSKAFKS
jgi:hypothetical protein